LVIPVGHDEQILKRITRVTEDKYETETLEAVRFVPLLSGTVR
jgi:protein-L-isoaspartate(D-aspartate) O-methyltransferase